VASGAMSTLLSVNNYFYWRGGGEVVFLERNEIMRQRGWQVDPFSMNHARNEPSDWSDYFVDTVEFGETYSLLEKVSCRVSSYQVKFCLKSSYTGGRTERNLRLSKLR
jgi:hypothetical protein